MRMKLLCFFAFSASLILSSLQAQNQADFESLSFKITKGEERRQHLKDDKEQRTLQWDENANNYSELYFTRPTVIQNSQGGIFYFEFTCPKETVIENLGLRLSDCNGEVLSFQGDLKRLPDTEILIGTVKMAPDAPQNSWGQNINKKVEFPAKLIGFRITKKGKDSGELKLDKITFVENGTAQED